MSALTLYLPEPPAKAGQRRPGLSAGPREGRLTHIRPAHLLISRAAEERRAAPDGGNTVVTLHRSKGDLYRKAGCSANTLSPHGADCYSGVA